MTTISAGRAGDEVLVELHRTGRLVAEYPTVTSLVADLTGKQLQRAGQLLSRLDADEVLRAHPTTPTVAMALTGHGTIAPIIAPLTAELARHGLLLRKHLADFDSYVFDLSDPGSALYQADADLVVCVLDANVIVDELPVPWQPSDVERVAAEKIAMLRQLANRFTANSRGTLVLNTLPLPRDLLAQLVDHRSRALLGAIWREANAALLRFADELSSVVVFDLDPLVAEGIPAKDARLDVYAKLHISPDLLARYARELGHLARHVAGRTKKCLVVDLDNTVWGGVLGDDGPDGIEVDSTYRGEAFRAFQRVAKQITSQGVLLAAVSKNDQEPVRAVLRDHPRMTLREDDFVRVVANWRPKNENLVELAEALNVGVDSFVFVDDSPYECGLVRHSLPGVAVVQVTDEPANHVRQLLADGWFDVRTLTTEDRGRVAKYRDELVRKDFLQSFDSIESYLGELDVRTTLSVVTEPDVARVSQLSLRTNQFNLTTRRLQPAEVGELLDDELALVLAISASDRFGDNGLVGAIFARWDDDNLHIDNFVLSCRVFSRGIEQAGLSALLRHARANGAGAVQATYRPTAKNHTVKDFYPRYGFRSTSDDADASGTMTFRHDLVDIVPIPEHVELTTELSGVTTEAGKGSA
jgi:FkbH-like protein